MSELLGNKIVGSTLVSVSTFSMFLKLIYDWMITNLLFELYIFSVGTQSTLLVSCNAALFPANQFAYNEIVSSNSTSHITTDEMASTHKQLLVRVWISISYAQSCEPSELTFPGQFLKRFRLNVHLREHVLFHSVSAFTVATGYTTSAHF